MIIKYSDNNENRIEWQHRRGEEWKTAELDEMISAYEREKTGEWIVRPMEEWGAWNTKCSVCGYEDFQSGILVGRQYNFCPDCGAKMIGHRTED